jgi:hypothetical protein
MPWAKDGSSFRKHAFTEHTCKCGKVVKGNAFYNHTKHCKIWQENKFNPDREKSRSVLFDNMDNFFKERSEVNR